MPNELEEMAIECIDHASEFSDRESKYQNLKKKIVEKLRQVREKTILECAEVAEKLSYMEAVDGYLGLDEEDGLRYESGQEVKRLIAEAIRKLGGGK